MKSNNKEHKKKSGKYPFLESMNEDFAVDGESESDTEWLLESDHVLVEVHLERRRRGGIGHCENPKGSAIGAKKVLLVVVVVVEFSRSSSSIELESCYCSSSVVGAEIIAPKRRHWKTMEMKSSETRGLQLQRRGHFGD